MFLKRKGKKIVQRTHDNIMVKEEKRHHIRPHGGGKDEVPLDHPEMEG